MTVSMTVWWPPELILYLCAHFSMRPPSTQQSHLLSDGLEDKHLSGVVPNRIQRRWRGHTKLPVTTMFRLLPQTTIFVVD